MEMYGFAKGFRIEEEAVIRWLALGMVVAMLGMAVMPAVGVGDLGAIALATTYNPNDWRWWLGVAAEVMAIGAVILSPPVGLAAQLLTGGSLL